VQRCFPGGDCRDAGFASARRGRTIFVKPAWRARTPQGLALLHGELNLSGLPPYAAAVNLAGSVLTKLVG